MALYEPLKKKLFSNGSEDSGFKSFGKKLLAGGTAGGIGIAIANPTEVVKICLQADKTGKQFSGPIDVLQKVYKTQGVKGLFRGIVPNIQRGIIVNAAELGTYDHCKHFLISNGYLSNGLPAHAGASVLAGLAGAIASNPVDVLKTRLMSQSSEGAVGHTLKYSGMIDCLKKTVAEEGILTLYQGLLPNWLRKGPWCMVFFICYEQLLLTLN
jgi:hypothetical protein